jgi:hypothetical protein
MSDSEILDYLLKSGYFEIGAEFQVFSGAFGGQLMVRHTFKMGLLFARDAVEAAINEDFYGVRASNDHLPDRCNYRYPRRSRGTFISFVIGSRMGYKWHEDDMHNGADE